MKNSFDDALHSLTLSEDGSYTAYSKEYDEHYHSTKDGALKESLLKHVLPAFSSCEKAELTILDICYGLGFNTLTTLMHVYKNYPEKKIKIYSPELDEQLIKSLENFVYPKEFTPLREIILALSRDKVYEDEKIYIEIYIGDAREYIKGFSEKFDIVYQDAFSPKTNPVLWTQEYFADIKHAIKPDGILTTYSVALASRLALYNNGFRVYLNKGEEFRTATVASLGELQNYEEVNMQHKIACNPDKKALCDADLGVDYS